ncbi:MAG: DUF4302 domain-containing protein, partial [Chitinophagaceae bacterium]
MKNLKYFPLLMLFTVSFFACKKDTYVAQFDKLPQERMNEQMTMVKNALIGAENGWVATLPTGLGGGFGFYMSFDAEQFVNMVADLNDNAAATPQKTQYRIRQDMGTALTFDTYNYISILNNPETSAVGGTIREGFRSDIDFIFDRANGDTLVFIGKRYRQTFTLVKATAAQKAKYLGGEYKTSISQFKQFFIDNPNAYIELDNGQKVSVEPNGGTSQNAGKRITLTAILQNDAIVSNMAKFAYTIDRMAILDSGLKFNGVTFTRIAWKNATTLAMYDATGKEYIINNSPTPLLPLYKLWGSKYNGMLSNFKAIYPGTSTKGAEILNFFHQNMENGYTGFRFNFGRINFVWNIVNKRLTLNGFSSQNGGSSGWTTSVIYNYTVDANGVYTFTLNSNFSGGYVSAAMIPLHQFMLNNQVRFDYFVDG